MKLKYTLCLLISCNGILQVHINIDEIKNNNIALPDC